MLLIGATALWHILNYYQVLCRLGLLRGANQSERKNYSLATNGKERGNCFNVSGDEIVPIKARAKIAFICSRCPSYTSWQLRKLRPGDAWEL